MDTQSAEDDSIRSLLENAMQQSEADTSTPEPASTQAANENAEAADNQNAETPAKEAPSRDKTGRFAKGEKATKTTAKAASQVAAQSPTSGPAPAATGGDSSASPQADPIQELKIPQAWKAAVREKWNTLPAELKANPAMLSFVQEAVRREKEHATSVGSMAETKKVKEAYEQALAPYAQFAQAIGTTPIGLAQQASQVALQIAHGAPAVKAQTLAALIRSNNVDVQLLAQALDGQPVNTNQQPQFNPQQFAQQIKSSILQDIQQQRGAYASQQAQQDIETFLSKPEADLFEDVREGVGLRLQMAAQSGQVMSLEEAYQAELWANPETRAIIQQREQAKAAQANLASTQRAKNAASSVKAQHSAVANGNAGDTIRGAIQAAIDYHSGR